MIVVDRNIEISLLTKLKELDFVILTKENLNILNGINTHPDMLVRPLLGKDVVVDLDNYEYYKNFLKGYNIYKSKKLYGDYPRDVALNFVVFKNYFIHNLKATDEFVLSYYMAKGYKLIDVKQGYTKCNIVVGKNSLITSDVDIYNKLKDEINILLISHKGIELNNFNYGFIGGASGLVGDKIYFFGDIKYHKDGESIKNFLEYNKEKFVNLLDKPLKDYGSIIEIK